MSATLWQPYADFRATLTGENLNELTDGFDSVYRMKDAQLSLLRKEIVDLKTNPARAGFYASIPLPYEKILYSNVNLYLNCQNDLAGITAFLKTLGFNDLISHGSILTGIATVISGKNPLSNQENDANVLAFDSKCYDQHSVFITCGNEKQVFRLDWHSTSYPIESKSLGKFSENPATILSIIVSSVNYGYLTHDTVSTIVTALYPGTTDDLKANIERAIDAVVNPSNASNNGSPRSHNDIAIQRTSLRRRPLHPRLHGVSNQADAASDQHPKAYWIDVPMGTASTARAPIEAWFQSSLTTKYLNMSKTTPKTIPYFDVVCSEIDEVGSRLLVVVTPPPPPPSSDDEAFWSWGGFWGDVKSAAKSIASEAADWAVKKIIQVAL